MSLETQRGGRVLSGGPRSGSFDGGLPETEDRRVSVCLTKKASWTVELRAFGACRSRDHTTNRKDTPGLVTVKRIIMRRVAPSQRGNMCLKGTAIGELI